MNRNIFCGRKGGVTFRMSGKERFVRHPTTSDILAGDIERQSKKKEAQRRRDFLRHQRGE